MTTCRSPLAIRSGGLPVPLAILALLLSGPAGAITFTVNTRTDLGSDITPGDGFCWTGSFVPPSAAECTLRAALEEANAYPGADIIDFASGLAVDPFGSIVIFPNSALPSIVDPVTIDGTTAPTYATGDPWAVPVVHLNGNQAGSGAHGLRLLAGSDGSAILALGIVSFDLDGIKIGQFAPPEGVHSIRIEGCHIGLTRGTTLAGNGDDGIDMTFQATSNGAVIGQECDIFSGCLGRGNVIAANGGDGIVVNGFNNEVAGNRIGTSHDGTSASGTGNGGFGILVETGDFNHVGSSAFYQGGYVASGNLLSGNGAGGLTVTGDDTTIVANRIGTDVTGTIALANGGPGIWIQSDGNAVGDATAGLAVMNLVSGNIEDGIRVSGDDNDIDVNRVGVSVDGGGAMPNGGDGIRLVSGSGNRISDNQVSANVGDGIEIGGSGNEASGNRIGLDDAGTDLGNGGSGILVTGSSNQIGDVGHGNVIGFNVFGVRIEAGASLNAVEGNAIGTELGQDRGNVADGVLVVGSGNVIGGSDADPSSAGNLIGHNGDDGVDFDAQSVGNTLLGNRIGISAAGADVGNGGHGVRMAGTGNVVGAPSAAPGSVAAEGNAIAHNGGSGVRMEQVVSITNPIRGNRIQSNGGLGIDLGGPGSTPNDAFDGDAGANRLQNSPVLDASVTGVVPGSGQVVVRYQVDSSTFFASYPLVVDFYLADGGDGAVWIGSDGVVAPDAGAFRTLAFSPPAGVTATGSIVATATDSESTGNTSEFGAAVALPEPSLPVSMLVGGLALALLSRRRERSRGAGRLDHARRVACVGAGMTALFAGSAGAVVLADSVSDWNPGLQYANDWAYGWRNLATHPGAYDVSHFQLFLNDASGGSTPVSQTGPNHWDGTAWDFGVGAPWTHLGQIDCHPNGINNVEEHWVIRRWSSGVTQPIRIVWQLADVNPGGTGVTGRLFVEGVERASFSNDGAPVDLVYYLNYHEGDRIDFAITPVGVDLDPSDAADGVQTTILIDTEIPAGAVNPLGVVADSVADFSGIQGQDGWTYGYYDQRLDVETGNRTYDVADFVPFLNDGSGQIANDPVIGAWMSHPNHWSGIQWDLFDQNAYFQGPWTYVSSQRAEPAANGQIDPSVHWAVRRWVSDFEGIATLSGVLDNDSLGGDGVRGRFFLDGFEYYSQLSDGSSVPFEVDVPVVVGSVLDFALDADGALALNLLDPGTLDLLSDTSDQSFFEIQVEGHVEFVPEPSALAQLIAGLATLLALDRRRGAAR